jgi:hypothetical protein
VRRHVERDRCQGVVPERPVPRTAKDDHEQRYDRQGRNE